jgi:hypothetical protein
MSTGSPLSRLSTRSLSSTAKRPRSPDALDSQQPLNAKRPKPVSPSPSIIPALQEEDPKYKERKRAEREAQREEFRAKYTRAFPKFSFYLHWDVSEGDPDARERLHTRINYMDAVRLYFSCLIHSMLNPSRFVHDSVLKTSFPRTTSHTSSQTSLYRKMILFPAIIKRTCRPRRLGHPTC